MVRLSSTAEMLAALRSASSVTFSAYMLRPGPVEQALAAAARRGASVRVRLEGDLWGGTRAMNAANLRSVQALQRSGADAKIVHRPGAGGPALHMKAAVCDGAAFLDDCNWNASGDTVIEDTSRAHVRAVREAALQHGGARCGNLALDKAHAIAREAALLRAPRVQTVRLESEALHPCAVTARLRQLARAGVRVRVLLSQRCVRGDPATLSEVRSLQRDGVVFRVARSGEKFAVAGNRAWVGSADATGTRFDGDRIEWAIATRDANIVGALRRRFTERWRASKAM